MKILIFTKNWLGDILFEEPALRAIRENFPEARLTALAPARCREILEAIPYLDEIRQFDERGSERSFFSKLRFLTWLRQEKFDKVFLFHRSFTRAFLAWLGRIPQRIGYETPKRRGILTTAVPPPRQMPHQVDYFLLLLKWAGLRVKFGAEYRFFYRPDEEARALQLLEMRGLKEKGFAAFHLGANWEPKKWPRGNFSRLAEEVSRNFSCPVVLTGACSEESAAEEIIQKARQASLISLCGKTSLGVLGALYRRAAFVVSSDSGPLHIASGVGTPVVALFGPTSPELTGPRGTGRNVVIQFVPEGVSVPWRGKDFPPGGWMEKISPEEVLARIKQENLWLPAKEKISLSSR